MFVSLFGLLLAIGKSSLLEELPGMVICSLRAAGASIFEWNREQEQERPCAGNNIKIVTTPYAAKPLTNTCRTRENISSPAVIQVNGSPYGTESPLEVPPPIPIRPSITQPRLRSIMVSVKVVFL